MKIAWLFISLLLLSPCIYLAFLTLGAILQRLFGRETSSERAKGHVAIVVPAHNEELDIAATVASIGTAADAETSIHVIADNCTDETAKRAREAGAVVWERSDETLRSKGYALEWAIPKVLVWGDQESKRIEYLAVIDADATLSVGSLDRARQAFASGAEVLQSENLLLPGKNLRGRVATIGFSAMNIVRGLGRLWWGSSDTLKGNGMWFKRSILDRYPWKAYSLAEDFEFAVNLIRAGVQIRILSDSRTTGAPAPSTAGLKEQRLRWEAGRLALVIQFLPAVFMDFLRAPSRSKLDLVMEIATPPLAILVAFYLLTLLWTPTRIWIGIPAMILLSFHVLLAIPIGRLPMKSYLDLLLVPAYMAWKLALLPLIWARRRSKKWVRAERGHSNG